MKHLMRSNLLACVLLAIAFAMIGSIACSTAGEASGVQEQKQIATACAGITAAVSAIAAGAESGQVSKADARKALDIAKPTAAFCEPKPAAHLGPVEYAALLAAAADLATRKEKLR